LVSAFTGKLGLGEYFDPLNESFAERDFDWEQIRENIGKIELFHGKNDPYVPLDNAMGISDSLDAPIHVYPNGKHLNQDSGFTEIPLLLERLTTL